VVNPEAERLERHYAECSQCAAVVQQLHAEDTLVEAMRAQATAAELPEKAVVVGLISRLKSLVPADAGPHEPPSSPPMAAPRPSGTSASDSSVEPYDFLAPAQEPGELGRLGPYRVVRELGRGGMGVVFLAEDPKLKRSLALKAMLPSVAARATARERFLREAQAAAAIENDHIIAIHHVGEENGIPFLAMPLLKGEPLDQWLRRGRRPTVAQILRLGREIAKGLAAAHERGLIHRDIKPGNVWLEAPTGRVKLLDFGLARAVDDDIHLTESGLIAGTPAYMAPEQARAEKVDARCDLFSLGCVLYQLCSGELPFQGATTLAILSALALDTPRPLAERVPNLPAGLADLVMQLLAKDPAQRPASAKAVVAAIQAIERNLAGPPAPAPAVPASTSPGKPAEQTIALPPRRTAPANKPARPARFRKGMWAAALLLSASILGLGAWGLTRVPSGDGTFVVQTDDPHFRLEVGKTGATLSDLKTGRTYDLKVLRRDGATGEYELEVTDPDGGLVFKTRTVTIQRNGQLALTTWFERRPQDVQTVDSTWKPGQAGNALPGIIPRPADLPGVGRWQVETALPRGEMVCLAFSPNGRLLACGDRLGQVRIFEAGTPRLVGLLLGHTSGVNAVAWSRDGKRLATASNDGTARLWEADGTPGPVLKGHAQYVWSVAWSPDGKRLASAGEDGTVRLWDTDGTPKAVLKGHAKPVLSVDWAPDGKQLASASSDQTVRLWGADSTAVRVLQGHARAVRSVAWRPDGKQLASGSEPAEVRLWEADGTPGAIFKDGGASLAWSPDGRRLASADNTHRLILICQVDGSAGSACKGHEDQIYAVAWSPDGKWLASASRDGTLRLWAPDGTPATVLKRAASSQSAVAWSPDGKHLASASDWPGQAIHMWGLDGVPRMILPGHEGGVKSLAWNPDGRRLASGGTGDGLVKIWQADGKEEAALKAHRQAISSVAWSPDGNHLASASHDQTVKLWSAEGKAKAVLKGQVIAWSPDGKRLASGTVDRGVQLWSADGTPGAALKGHGGYVVAVAWSPDGKYLASAGSADRAARLWTSDGGEGPILKNHTGRISAVAWSPDGKHLASGDQGTVRLWGTDGKLGPVLGGHAGDVWSVTWHPGGNRVTSCGSDGTIRHWDVARAEPLWLAIPLTDNRSATFSGTGQLLHGDLEKVEQDFVHVIEQPGGRLELLKPSEFRRRIAAATNK
jgi:WD40 repeat protein